MYSAAEIPLNSTQSDVSGYLRQQERSKLVFSVCARKLTEWLTPSKGQAENGLYQLADERPNEFEAYSIRPCGIYQPKPRVKDWLITTFVLPSLRVEALAAAMVKTGKDGYEKRIIDHQTAKEFGEYLLLRRSDER